MHGKKIYFQPLYMSFYENIVCKEERNRKKIRYHKIWRMGQDQTFRAINFRETTHLNIFSIALQVGQLRRCEIKISTFMWL